MNCRKCKAEIPDESIFCLACGAKQVQEPRKKGRRVGGTGSVYKLQGHRNRPWVARTKNRVIIGYYETKSAATEALNRLTGQDITERYNMTFADVYDAWKVEHFKSISPAAQKAYEGSYNVFAPLHNEKFRSLRTSHFQKIIDENGEKKEAVKKYRQLISQLSKWAQREEVITTNFAQFVTVQSSQSKEKPVFTNDEIIAIESDGSEAARIVCMLLSTGMRIGELFALRLADYHGDYVVGGSKTEAGRNRVIPIRPEGRAHFEYFARQSAGMDTLLGSYTGNKDPHNFRKREYNELLKKLGIDTSKTPHATRHTYASRAVQEGTPPEILQKILGHADYSTTANIYTHIDTKTLVAAVSKNAQGNK